MSHVFVNGTNQGQDQNSIQSYLKRLFGFEEESLSSGERVKVSSNVMCRSYNSSALYYFWLANNS